MCIPKAVERSPKWWISALSQNGYGPPLRHTPTHTHTHGCITLLSLYIWLHFMMIPIHNVKRNLSRLHWHPLQTRNAVVIQFRSGLCHVEQIGTPNSNSITFSILPKSFQHLQSFMLWRGAIQNTRESITTKLKRFGKHRDVFTVDSPLHTSRVGRTLSRFVWFLAMFTSRCSGLVFYLRLLAFLQLTDKLPIC